MLPCGGGNGLTSKQELERENQIHLLAADSQPDLLKQEESGYSIGLSHIQLDLEETLFPENSPKTQCVTSIIIWRKPVRLSSELSPNGFELKEQQQKGSGLLGRKLDVCPMFLAWFLCAKKGRTYNVKSANN